MTLRLALIIAVYAGATVVALLALRMALELFAQLAAVYGLLP